MKTRFLRWGLMLGLPVMAAFSITWNVLASTGDGMCPAVDPLDHTVLLPNPEDCSSFFSCSNGVPILMHCPDGLEFNSEVDVCDWPQNAGCDPNKNRDALNGYHRGRTGTNWKTYTVTCGGTGSSTTGSSTGGSVGGSYNGVNGSVTGSNNNSSTTNYDHQTWNKDVCGSGSGWCMSSAPSGHPCA